MEWLLGMGARPSEDMYHAYTLGSKDKAVCGKEHPARPGGGTESAQLFERMKCRRCEREVNRMAAEHYNLRRLFEEQAGNPATERNEH